MLYDQRQGYPSDYVGVNIKQLDKKNISLSQPALIDTIIKDASIRPHTTIKYVSAFSSRILQYFTEYPDFDGHFHYWSLISKLNYLAQLKRLDIQFAVHSCARCSTCA